MRILLVEPAKAPVTAAGEDVFLFESLALEYIAAGVVGEDDVSPKHSWELSRAARTRWRGESAIVPDRATGV